MVINLEQNLSKLFLPVQYSMSAISFFGENLFVGLIDTNSKSSVIIYKSDLYLNFDSKCEFFIEITPNQTSLQ